MLKKALALVGLSVSSFVFAGTMGPICTPGNVTVPCEAQRWDIGVQALYLKAVTNNSYARVSEHVHDTIDSDWDWGSRLEGSFHFNTGNDVTLNWTHFSDSSTPSGFIGTVSVASLTNVPFTVNYDNRFDQVNLVMGQYADFSAVKHMRFYGGLQYANIQSNQTNFYSVAVPSLQITAISLFNNSDFKGVGPTIGIDYSYDLTDALSVTANGATGILYGTSRYNAGYVGSPINLVMRSAYGAKKAMVPVVEAKLGLNYGYAMPQGVLNIEGGYQALNYFNALQAQALQNIAANTLLATDYGLYGPYLGVKYLANA